MQTQTREFIKIPETDIIQEIEREIEKTESVIAKNDSSRKVNSYLTKIYHLEAAIQHLLGKEIPEELWLYDIAKTIRQELDMRLILYPNYIGKHFSREQANLQYARLRAALAIIQRKHVLILNGNTETYRKGILNCCLRLSLEHKDIIHIGEQQLIEAQKNSVLVWENPTGGHYLFNQLKEYAGFRSRKNSTRPPILIMTTNTPMLEIYLKGYDLTIGIFNLVELHQKVALNKIKLDFPELFIKK